MKQVQYVLNKNLSPFVNCIMTSESDDVHGHLRLPLYADGYPGLMFQQSNNGVYLLPKNKQLSEFYL